MKFILKRYLFTVASIFIVSQIIPAFSIADSWYGLFYAGLFLTFLLYIVKPILNLVMLPLNLVTLNLSAWIVYIAIFYLWTFLFPQVKITSWEFPGATVGPITLSSFNLVKWQVTIIAAVAVNFIIRLLDSLFK